MRNRGGRYRAGNARGRPAAPAPPPATGRSRTASLTDHVARGPGWRCELCREPFPCSTWTNAVFDNGLRTATAPHFLTLAQAAVRDLRGRPGGPTPPEIVKRFLWFLSLTDEEARAVALRVRGPGGVA